LLFFRILTNLAIGILPRLPGANVSPRSKRSAVGSGSRHVWLRKA